MITNNCSFLNRVTNDKYKKINDNIYDNKCFTFNV